MKRDRGPPLPDPLPRSAGARGASSPRASPPVALVCGHVTLDVMDGALVPGGSAYYAARALAGLGAHVRVLTAAGPDLPPDPFGPGVEAVVLPAPATTTFENVYGPGGRRTQRVLSAAPPLDPRRLPAAWREADLLLLAPVLGELDPAAFAATVRARAVGLCVQGLVRTVRPDGSVAPRRLEPRHSGARTFRTVLPRPRREPGRGFGERGPAGRGERRRPLLAGVDVAVLGEDELAGQADLVEALSAAVPVVVVTRGARGCDVVAGGRTRHVGTYPTRELEPTGAGDVFAAALLLALARGDAPAEAARLGAAAASIVVEGRAGEALARVGEAWTRAAQVPIEPA